MTRRVDETSARTRETTYRMEETFVAAPMRAIRLARTSGSSSSLLFTYGASADGGECARDRATFGTDGRRRNEEAQRNLGHRRGAPERGPRRSGQEEDLGQRDGPRVLEGCGQPGEPAPCGTGAHSAFPGPPIRPPRQPSSLQRRAS